MSDTYIIVYKNMISAILVEVTVHLILVASLFINYYYLGNGVALQVVICTVWVLLSASYGMKNNNRFVGKDAAIKYLTKESDK